MDALSRLSEMSRQILALAKKEAAFFQHDEIRTEHILLAIAAVPQAVASHLLRRQDVDPQAVVREVVSHLYIGRAVDTRTITLSLSARWAIEAAGREAHHLDSEYIGTEHLLLGMMADRDSVAGQVLATLSIDLDAVRRQAAGLSGTGHQPAAGGDTPAAPTIPRPPIEGERPGADATAPAPAGTPGSGQDRTGDGAATPRFDTFTERARKVLVLAQEEAQRFNHNYIGTEHLLLGLVREGEGIAAKVLGNLGVEPNRVRSAVEFIIGRGDRMVIGDMSFTPRSKKVIELAVEEARRLNHNYVGTEHLLLGLVREGEGIAAGVLESLGASLEKVRSQVLQVLGQPDGDGPPGGPPAG